MKISFIIPAYNEEAYLGACLSALETEIIASGMADDSEVIVVNNASTDATQDVAERYSRVALVFEPVKGITRAKQSGLEAARGEIVAFFDADTVVSKGWVRKALFEFTKDSNTIAASGPCIYYDLPVLWRVVAWPYEIVIGGLVHFLTGRCVAGGNFAARRKDLLDAGGFDASISFYGEDLDVARRLARIGKIRFTYRLAISTSARRFNAEGVMKTAGLYAANFLSMVLLNRPVRAEYTDIR